MISPGDNRLLIDLGNTRLKWALSNDAHGRASVAGGATPGMEEVGQRREQLPRKPGATPPPPEWRTGAVLHRDRPFKPLLQEALGALTGVREIWVCSVASAEKREALATWCAEQWSVPPRFIEALASACGVRNGYSNPAQLGADRWAALVGARAMLRSASVIVDCGTAITVDALSADGGFIGGVILPGLVLQRSALLQGTAGLGASVGATQSCQARSTTDAIAAGTVIGIAGAIERIVAEHGAALGATPRVLLTGGDAAVIAPHLRLSITAVPDLVLRGMECLATC